MDIAPHDAPNAPRARAYVTLAAARADRIAHPDWQQYRSEGFVRFSVDPTRD
ncbi:MAG: hypothetical protein WAV27_03320 [Xanthobacteraceae bacterium]